MKSKTRQSNGEVEKAKGARRPLASAKSKAVALLARREHSQLELRNKLSQRGYEQAEIDEAIQWVTAHQFQSDDRFKTSLYRRRASTFGDRAIVAELAQHGLNSSTPAQSGSELETEQIPEADRAYDWILRRQSSAIHQVFPSESNPDPEQVLLLKAKVFRGLSSRGFEFGNIERAWRRILSEFKSNA